MIATPDTTLTRPDHRPPGHQPRRSHGRHHRRPSQPRRPALQRPRRHSSPALRRSSAAGRPARHGRRRRVWLLALATGLVTSSFSTLVILLGSGRPQPAADLHACASSPSPRTYNATRPARRRQGRRVASDPWRDGATGHPSRPMRTSVSLPRRHLGEGGAMAQTRRLYPSRSVSAARSAARYR
jgi:hypothetical protein